MLEIIFTNNLLHNLIALHGATFLFAKRNNIGGICTSTQLVELMKKEGPEYLDFILTRFKMDGIINDEPV